VTGGTDNRPFRAVSAFFHFGFCGFFHFNGELAGAAFSGTGFDAWLGMLFIPGCARLV
jgi:hypothetical protein